MTTLTDVPVGSLVALRLPEAVLHLQGRTQEQASHVVVGHYEDSLVIFPLHVDWTVAKASLVTPERVLVTQEV